MIDLPLLSTGAALYSTSGCKNPRSPGPFDNDFAQRTPGLREVDLVDLATDTLLLEADGDDAVVVVDALLDATVSFFSVFFFPP